MQSLVDEELHLILFCHRCDRELRVTPWRAVEMFGERCTMIAAKRRMKCSWCGEREQVEARPCSLDMDAKRVVESARRLVQMWPGDEKANTTLDDAQARWEARKPKPGEDQAR